MLAANDALEARLRHVETKPRLDLDAVDEAIARIRDPDAVRARLGDALLYAQRVESEVGGLGIETLLPHRSNDYVGRFLNVWVPDEQGHGEAQARLATRVGLVPYAPRPTDAVPVHNRVAGLLARLWPRARGIVELTYHTIGAINERLALEAYRRMAVILERLGERELSGALMVPMRNDEAAHLAYYRTYARQLRPTLASWQLAAVRALIVHTYAPVGAGDHKDKAPMGRALLALEEDPDDPRIAPAVQSIAEELLAGRKAMRPFVRDSLQRCVHHAQRASVAV